MPEARFRVSTALKARPSIVPLLAPLSTMLLSPVPSTRVSLPPLPTSDSTPLTLPAMAVAPPASVLPLPELMVARLTVAAPP